MRRRGLLLLAACLDPTSACARDYSNCYESKCCSSAAFHCFRQNGVLYAQCLKECKATTVWEGKTSQWDCASAWGGGSAAAVDVPSLSATEQRHVLQSCGGDCVIDFRGEHGRLLANGAPFAVKGINWYGSESHTGPPDGLQVNSAGFYWDYLASHSFNAARFLFNHESVLSNGPIATTKTYTGGPHKGQTVQTIAKAPELAGKDYLGMFLELAKSAASRGILVMMAMHRLNPGAWPGDGLWYDSHITEAKVLESWTKLGRALCGQWNVFVPMQRLEPWNTGLHHVRHSEH